jgi:ubiquinone/menaquinone biosynthesis C-methylase UbiE
MGLLYVLVQTCGMTSDWLVADIGSGTGNLARLFLDAGHQVIGVEPNLEMRKAGERMLADHPAFHSLDGTAECIPLETKSVDLVTVGQALHWFDVIRQELSSSVSSDQVDGL